VKNEKYYIESRRKGISYIQLKKANWTGHILCRNCLLKHVIEGMIDIRIDIMGGGGEGGGGGGDDNVSSCRMTLRKDERHIKNHMHSTNVYQIFMLCKVSTTPAAEYCT